jgi:hypothetical protein
MGLRTRNLGEAVRLLDTSQSDGGQVQASEQYSREQLEKAVDWRNQADQTARDYMRSILGR